MTYGLCCFHALKASVKNKHISVDSFLRYARVLLVLVILVSVSGCAALTNRSGKSYVINGKRYYIMASATGYKEKGLASWYGVPFHGRKTASGEVYDMNQISAAHKTLPLHTWVEVRNLDNNKKLVLRINDRGPFVRGRVIDLSRKAAEDIGMIQNGVAKVTVRAISETQARKMIASGGGARPEAMSAGQ